ncbi:unnamed protein product [Clonostachys byssicola]|uniref:N-acetyltransferase domain-containing protein n=1 Tax=Clonostachys byssicola TaxID=160290 RepID=A0A9N9XXN4_9HYPO|nr:unnamed protein product [Clonostachys byssicola]
MPSTVQTPGNQKSTPKANPNLHFVKTFNGKLEVAPDNVCIATCTAHLVDRGDNPSRFRNRMMAASDETGELAEEIFTPNGRLLPEHRGPQPTLNGVMDWSEAFDIDNVLTFTHIKIAKAYRRKGLGRDLVEGILHEATSGGKRLSAFVAPGALESEYKHLEGEERERVIKEQVDICVQFWYSLGFRRVKRTNWLALKVQPDARAA